MLKDFSPENEILKDCPILMIVEVTIEGVVHRTSNIAINNGDLPMALAATMFNRPEIGEQEQETIDGILTVIAIDSHWLKDDATGAPIDCHVDFKDGDVAVTVRFFALPQISLDPLE